MTFKNDYKRHRSGGLIVIIDYKGPSANFYPPQIHGGNLFGDNCSPLSVADGNHQTTKLQTLFICLVFDISLDFPLDLCLETIRDLEFAGTVVLNFIENYIVYIFNICDSYLFSQSSILPK